MQTSGLDRAVIRGMLQGLQPCLQGLQAGLLLKGVECHKQKFDIIQVM